MDGHAGNGYHGLDDSITNGMSSQYTSVQSPSTSEPNPVTCWFLDTRTLWAGNNIWAAQGAAQALSYLTTQEQNTVTTKMFIQDARMSLASALLKRLYVSKTLGIPFKDVKLGRKLDPKHGKPCAVDKNGKAIEEIDFNVSHQAGLVALIGIDRRKHREMQPVGVRPSGLRFQHAGVDPMVGVDIVCVNERDDYRTIDAEGLDGWVDIYDFVFSEEERWSMKYDCDYVTLLDGTVVSHEELGRHDRCLTRNRTVQITTQDGRQVQLPTELIIDAKLRRFYTFFCYKEAYIKLAGEALLAPWLRNLEFFNVRSPKQGTVMRCSTHGTWGEVVDDVEVHLHGNVVDDVKMKIQAFEENFMISTAIQGDGVADSQVPDFEKLDLESDVMAWANNHFMTD
ncbi:putative phosphopantetheinyl transferase [Polychaeton citri CBS 116435]|uniref:holo-[acyl-carrier-protein] synthase n=1 Tax=Polychaeton citri CBS 116435 TaxID=1314669 RepID=A0A9P4USR5_9PEZI|nr:putative phosphopantetheinyl transferase [Polychaeton citri CBS 116435]